MENTPQQEFDQPLETPRTAKYSPSQIAIFLGGIIFLLVLAGAAFTAFNSSSNIQSNEKTPQAETTKPLNLAPYSLVYGVWTTSNSLIKAFDLESGKTYLLASLPTNVKKITVLDSNRLLYIGNTDTQDHGKEIDIYDIKNKKSTTVIKATDNFGIDDYVVSPNKQYLSDWEVQTDPDTGALYGGKSSVYSTRIESNLGKKNLIYNETIDKPIHYPRGILNDGTIYTDTFLPNSGAGWAYGMSVSDFTGTNKHDLSNMTNGTYGTQPELSPDGKYFVFAGYDGKNGDGTDDSTGYRQALVSPDTIELLNTTTNQRTKLENISNTNTYTSVSWNNNGENIVYTQISQDVKDMGLYEYNLPISTPKKISIKDENQSIITQIPNDDFLTGTTENDDSKLGNLGNDYAQTVSNPHILNTATNSLSSIPIKDPLIQFIDTEPTSYFAQNSTLLTTASNNQLQLQTFPLKPSLAPVRIKQQSSSTASSDNPKPELPICQSLISQQAKDTCKTKSTYYDPTKMDMSDQTKCTEQAMRSEHIDKSKCSDSPLYLYGASGTKVKVKILTPVSGTSPSYKDKTGYNFVLQDNGDMNIDGNNYTRISYNYTPALRSVIPPSYGRIVSRDNVQQTLFDYANQLGLNSKETNDLIAESLPQLSSPYVFISFFDHNTSKAILPISFSPKPDTYRNIVFYFKQLESKPNYSVQPPVFEKIQRYGFTAVEISEMVE